MTARNDPAAARIDRCLAAQGLRWKLGVLAVGAIARIAPNLDVQKVSATELIVRRNGRTRRVAL